MSKATQPAIEASIRQACKQLHLPTVGARATALSQDAAKSNNSHLEFLDALLEAEIDDRAERRRQRRISEARFPRLKRLEDFNFEDAPKIPAAAIRDLATGAFIDRAENVILLGESGTGKSHLATALSICACMQSRRVRFVTIAGLVNELIEARDEKRLSKLIARYARYDLLALDELAYVPLTQPEAELLFQVLDQRSEISALLITTNLPFSEWTNVFPEQRLCKAVIDRLTFNAHIIETGTESWRFKKTMAKQDGKAVKKRH
ncbi:MAG: IS21-like element helper ATPase IstB [Actinomycetota bacterium]